MTRVEPFTPAQQTRLRDMRAQGTAVWEQVAEFRCSPQTLNREVKRLGLLRQGVDKRKFAQRWEAGASIEELMVEFNRKESTVRATASKLGLTRPKAHPWAQIADLKAKLAAAQEEIARLRGANGAARPAARREESDGVRRRA
jgi:hypothetical protein